jgi:hypothetical protein
LGEKLYLKKDFVGMITVFHPILFAPTRQSYALHLELIDDIR